VFPAVILFPLLLLGGCHAEQREGRGTDEANAVAAASADKNGRVIDLADVLTPAEEQSLAARCARLSADSGRTLTVILIQPEGQSLEQVGWAVGSGSGANRPIMILADPMTRQVRIEGELPAEAKARIAAAMQEGLKAGRAGLAVERGLIRLGEVIA
jgi:hypothetical protein